MRIHAFGMLFLALLMFGPGCTSGPEVVPEAFKANIDSTVTFPMVREEPTVHQGTMVLLGGEVLTAKRLKEGTRLEILQLPLDGSEEPVLDRAASQGRFFAFESSSFLDPATLPPNTRITLVGEITGATRDNLDEMEYRYPMVTIKHLHVWPELEPDQPGDSGLSYGIFGGGSTGGRVGGGVGIGIGF
ncbi:MAG: Slp family lipoprotein [Nitrospirales bacterium]